MAAGGGLWNRRSEAGGRPPTRFLITLGAFGGASIIDSFLAVTDTEVSPQVGATLNVFPRNEVVASLDHPFRGVNRTAAQFFGETYVGNQGAFIDAHHGNMLVATQTGTSVNHTLGQQRSITGNGAWNGRTLQEAVSIHHGEGFPLPNVTMGALGFREDGADDSVPAWARAHSISDPQRWPLSLDGLHGIDDAPTRDVLEIARSVRDESLDPHTRFTRTFLLSERLEAWKRMRGEDVPRLENAGLLEKLNFGLDDPSLPPFDPADRAALDAAFGHLTVDPLQMQAAMAYLLIKNGLSVAVTLSPTWNVETNPDATGEEHRIINTPLSFDYSHTQHRNTQTMMWRRMLNTLDPLIALLRGAQHPEAPGESLFDHTVIYVATDFGRTRNRPEGSLGFGTGHGLNNGNLLLSGNLLAGGTLLGGVDPSTALTYGYDPLSGAPMPGTEMPERVMYSGILQALDVDRSGSGLPAVPAMLPA